MVRTTIMILAAAAAILTLAAGVALADGGNPFSPPKAALSSEDGRVSQKGVKVAEYSWSQPTGDGGCVVANALLETSFPEARAVAAGTPLRIRVHDARRPNPFEIVSYRRLDADGMPAGRGREIRRSLEPVVRDGRTVAWDARFRLNQPGRQHYLIADGHWKGCDGIYDFALWSFHLRTRG